MVRVLPNLTASLPPSAGGSVLSALRLRWAWLGQGEGSGLPAEQVLAWPGELPVFLVPLEQGLPCS